MGKHYFIFEDGSVVNQVICAIIINISAFSLGAKVASLNFVSSHIEDSTIIDIDDFKYQMELGSVAMTCGNVLACFGIVCIETKYGRTACLLFTSVAFAASWLLDMCWPTEMCMYIISNGILGIAIAGSYLICPIYTKEISQDSIRGVLGSFITIFEELGKIFVNSFLSLKTAGWVCLSIQLVHIMLIPVLPESPSFLLHTGNIVKTQKNLSWLRCRNENDSNVMEELEVMKKEIESDESNDTCRIKTLFKDVKLFRAFRIILFLNVARLFSGGIAYIMFGAQLLQYTEETSTEPTEIIDIGFIFVCVAVEIVGRKILLFGTFMIASINMCLITTMFLGKQYGFIGPPWLVTIALSTCRLCDAVSLTWMPIITTEMFSFKYRGIVLSSTVVITAVALLLVGKFQLLPLNDSALILAGFFILAVCFGSSLFVWFYVPEVTKKTVEQIYEELKK